MSAAATKARALGWDEAVREGRRMGKVKNEVWFFDALAARNPHRATCRAARIARESR